MDKEDRFSRRKIRFSEEGGEEEYGERVVFRGGDVFIFSS